MFRPALALVCFSLCGCVESRTDDRLRANAVAAVDFDAAQLTPLASVEQAVAWSGRNSETIAAYATGTSEGLVWVPPGLSCSREAFHRFAKVELIGPLPLRRGIEERLSAHNRAVLDAHPTSDCVPSG